MKMHPKCTKIFFACGGQPGICTRRRFRRRLHIPGVGGNGGLCSRLRLSLNEYPTYRRQTNQELFDDDPSIIISSKIVCGSRKSPRILTLRRRVGGFIGGTVFAARHQRGRFRNSFRPRRK